MSLNGGNDVSMCVLRHLSAAVFHYNTLSPQTNPPVKKIFTFIHHHVVSSLYGFLWNTDANQNYYRIIV